MGSIDIYLAALATILFAYAMLKWKKPQGKRRNLPPGSMGLPFIGETIQFCSSSKSLDIPRFMSKRMQKYGTIFKTRLAGQPVVISTDADFNHYLLQKEASKIVDVWYTKALGSIVDHSKSWVQGFDEAYIHKCIRGTIASKIGSPDFLRAQLPSKLGEYINPALDSWPSKDVFELKKAVQQIIVDLSGDVLFGYDPNRVDENLGDELSIFENGLLSLPFSIPGTAFYKSMQAKKRIFNMIQETIDARKACPETRKDDLLDEMMRDMESHESFLTDKSAKYVCFALLIAASGTVPTVVTLAIKLIMEHPLVMQELLKEYENHKAEVLSWKEYKSMTFTMHVVNEACRIANASLVFRKAIEDIHINGYTIPKGWAIYLYSTATHLSAEAYKDPLAFNPWRWQEQPAIVGSQNFLIFGTGPNACVAAEFSKMFIATFLHSFLTKYRWVTVKGDEIVRKPVLTFGKGYFIKVTKIPNCEGNEV